MGWIVRPLGEGKGELRVKESRKLLLGSAMAVALLIGLVAVTASAERDQEGKNKNYKKLLRNLNGSVRALRGGGEPSGSLRKAQRQYNKLVAGENLEARPELENLNHQINGIFRNRKGADVDNIRDLKDKVSRMAGEIGVGLPFALDRAPLIVLGFALSLAFLANMLCKRLIDWERLGEAKRRMKDWRKKLREARRKKGKKKRKLELREDEVTGEREKIWGINVKQAAFYLAPFFLFLAWLGYVYGDWTIVWLPFNWFSSGAFQSIGVSLGFFGWFLLSYFGFAQVWRRALLPKR